MTWINIANIVADVLTALANLFLTIYVYKKNSKDRINKNFFYLGVVLSLWCLSNLLFLFFKDIFWLRATYAIGSLGSVAGIFFTSALAGQKINKQVKVFLFTLIAIVFVTSLFTPFIIKDFISFSDMEVSLGPLFNVWAASLIILIFISLYIPFSAIHKVAEQRKKQILYFTIGATVYALWTTMVSIILPALGYNELSNFDSTATIFLVGFTSYSIIRYNLMNITSLFFRAFIYSLAIVLIVVFLLLLVFVSSFFLEHLIIWPIYIIVALIAIALFFIGRLFFKEKRALEEAKINLTELLEKSEANRVLAETERDRTATIISSFSDSLIILDENDEIFSINPEAEKVLELETDKLLKKPLQSLSYSPKAEPIVSILKTGFEVSKKEIGLTKDLIMELSVIPLNLNEKDIGHLIVLHDVSREKIIEKIKTEFVSLAAHQLRTPLSIIKWSMDMLKKGDFGKLNKKQGDVIGRTAQNNERLISLVNDLLNVTRIEEGRYLYNIAPADIKTLVDLVIDSYGDEIKKRKIQIDFAGPDDLPQVMVDTEKMKLVIQNFIDNAIKYSPDGGKILITLKMDDKNIKFMIQDFGVGIPKNQQSKVFTKFFRANNAVKVNTVGSGLGLFLAQNIIEAHGGKTWFESEMDAGTTFYFTLPL